MANRRGRVAALLGVSLAAVCAIGIIAAGQRYFMLRALHDALTTQQVLNESFSVAITSGAVGAATTADRFAAAVQTHMAQSSDINRALVGLTMRLETLQILDGLMWIGALVLLLFATLKMRSTRRD